MHFINFHLYDEIEDLEVFIEDLNIDLSFIGGDIRNALNKQKKTIKSKKIKQNKEKKDLTWYMQIPSSLGTKN